MQALGVGRVAGPRPAAAGQRLQPPVRRRPGVQDADHAGAPEPRGRLPRQLADAAQGLQHAAVQRGVRALRLVPVERLLCKVRQGHDDTRPCAAHAVGEIQRGLPGPAGGSPALHRPGRAVPQPRLPLERVARLVRLLCLLRRRPPPPEPRGRGAARARRQGLRRARQERGRALQRAPLRRGLRRRQVGRLAGVGGLLLLLRERLHRAPQERRRAAQQLRRAGDGRQGGVPAVRRPTRVRRRCGLPAGGLERLVLLLLQVLRRQGAEPLHPGLCHWARKAMQERVPQGALALQPWAGRGALRRLRAAAARGLPAEPLVRLERLHPVLRRRPAPAQAQDPPAAQERRPALRQRHGDHEPVQLRALRGGEMHGLQMGRLGGLGRLLQVRRREVPPPLHRADAELLRQDVRPPERQGGIQLHRPLQGDALLHLDRVVRAQRLRHGLRHRDHAAHARAEPEGLRGRLPVRRLRLRQMPRRADERERLPQHAALHSALRSPGLRVCPVGRLEPAHGHGPLRAPAQHRGDQQRVRRRLPGPARRDEALPRAQPRPRGLRPLGLDRLERVPHERQGRPALPRALDRAAADL
mmetsp:Transcript_41859/g.119443  ORF Transcript_41859/g.119443 Transcript_41859/m.119443 type:complete len:584 (-) Transcript_41859:2150-3901(-)